ADTAENASDCDADAAKTAETSADDIEDTSGTTDTAENDLGTAEAAEAETADTKTEADTVTAVDASADESVYITETLPDTLPSSEIAADIEETCIYGDAGETYIYNNDETSAPRETLQVGTILTHAIMFMLTAVLAVLGVMIIHPVLANDLELMVCINGIEAGYVRDIGMIARAKDDIESSVSRSIGRKYTLDYDLTYHFRITDDDVIYLDYETCRELLGMRSDEITSDAYSLYIDDVYIASSESPDVLDRVKNGLHEFYSSVESLKDSQIDHISITNHFSVVPEERSKNSLVTPDEIIRMFTGRAKSGGAVNDVHNHDNTDASANTDSDASETSGLTRSISLDFHVHEDTNVDYGFTRVSGAERTDFSDMIKYDTVTYESHSEIVQYTVENVTSPYYYDGFTFKSQEGENGIIERVYEVVRRDGKIISNTLYATNEIIPMKPETYTTGTKEPPPPEPTGEFIWPITHDFMISSEYGINRGAVDGDAFHYGIDLTGEIGDYIFAADGGTVVFSGRRSSYGIVVMIQHGEQFRTYYAHMSEAFVKEGEKVYPGQLIGAIGMTGMTTGPHLHFEIRKNLVTVDPMDYMPEH
nr:peptidoglycan DD-metalloendopeptidase family protein [Clostridia bacterium]